MIVYNTHIPVDWFVIFNYKSNNQDMLLTRSLRLCYRMCQITPEIYNTLYKQFGQTLDLATLGKYYSSQNLVEVYNIIKHTKMKAEDKLTFYNKIE